MRDSDDKVVSISFDNKQFMNDVSNTLRALDSLNEATSSKNLKGAGLLDLQTSFQSLSKTAVSDINAINGAVRDGSAYEALAYNVGNAATSFNILQSIAEGVFRAIGGAVVDLGTKVYRNLTSGVRNGWNEYNLLMDSTQTILANTERYGTTLNDVTRALDQLNDYADKTIYNFSAMTRNIGYFTTAGSNLEDSVMAIKGLSNLGAYFGASNENVQRATYQMSQAISAGLVRLQDWKSLENASMAGKAFQDELIQTAAIMSGMSVDAFKDYIGYSRGFRNTLEANWLTADVFMETLRKFSGESREYWESLTDSRGNRLYSDEEIDRLMHLAQTAEEAATKVRTLKMLTDSIGEAIGSGWAETFRILVGDLNQAKEFWSPINDLLAGENGVISGIAKFRNSIVRTWAGMYREHAIGDMLQGLEGIVDVLRAIGDGFVKVFGGAGRIAQQIGLITEPIGDLAYTIRLTEDELEDLSDFVAGLLTPIALILDVIRELTRTFFNASDALNEFDERGDSFVDGVRPLRQEIFHILGVIGRVMQAGYDFVKENEWIRKGISETGKVIRALADIVDNVLVKAFGVLYSVWTRYDVTSKLIYFYDVFITSLINLGSAIYDFIDVIEMWFGIFKSEMDDMARSLDPLTDIKLIFGAVHDLFLDLIDPTYSITEAFANFGHIIASTTIWQGLLVIKENLLSLFNTLMNSPIGPVLSAIADISKKVISGITLGIGFLVVSFQRLGDVIKKSKVWQYVELVKNSLVSLYDKFKETKIGQIIIVFIESIKNKIHDIVDLFRGTEIGGAILAFIDNIRGVFESRFNLNRPNIITNISDITEDVHNAASKMVGLTGINDKIDTVRKIADNVKSVLTSLRPTSTGKNGPRNGNVIKDLFDTIEPFAEGAEETTKKVGKLMGALDNIASLDVEGAADKTEKLKRLVTIIVGIIQYLLNVFVTVMTVLALFNFSKWSNVISDGFQLLTVGLADGAASLALSITELGKTLAGVIKAWSTTFTEHYKAEQWESIASVFKTIAILVGVIFVGVALISQFGNPEALIQTAFTVSISVSMILMAVGGMVAMVMLSAKTLTAKLNPLKISSVGMMATISLLFTTISMLIGQMMLLMTSIGIIAIQLGKMAPEEQAAFFVCMDRMTQIMLVMSLMISVIISIFTAIANNTKPMEMIKGDSKKSINTLTSTAVAFSLMLTAFSGFMLATAAALILVTRLAPNAQILETAGKVFKTIAVVIGIFAVITSMFAAFAPEGVESLAMMTKHLVSISVMLFAFSAAIATVLISFGFMATMLGNMFSALIETIDNVEHATRTFRYFSQVMKSLITVMILVMASIGAIGYLVGRYGSWKSVGAMIAFAASLGVITFSLMLISTALSELLAATDLFGTRNLSKITNSLAILFGIIAAFVALLVALSTQIEIASTAVGILVTGSAAVVAASYAIMTIATGLSLLVASGSARRIEAATNGISKIMGGLITGLGLVTVLLAFLSGSLFTGSGAGGVLLEAKKFTEISLVIGAMAAAFISFGKGIAIAAAGIALLCQAGSANRIKIALDGIKEIFTTASWFLTIAAVLAGVATAVPALEGVAVAMAAGIGILAGGLLAIGGAIALAGTGLLAGAKAIDVFATAMNRLASIDVTRPIKQIKEFTESLPEILDNIIMVLPRINLITETMFKSVGSAIVQGLNAMFTTVRDLGSSAIENIVYTVGMIFVSISDGVLDVLAIYMSDTFGASGRIWSVMKPVGEFFVRAAGYAGYYGTLITANFCYGMAAAIDQLHLDEYISSALKLWWEGVKLNFAEKYGFNDWNSFWEMAGRGVVDWFIYGIETELANRLDSLSGIIDLGGGGLLSSRTQETLDNLFGEDVEFFSNLPDLSGMASDLREAASNTLVGTGVVANNIASQSLWAQKRRVEYATTAYNEAAEAMQNSFYWGNQIGGWFDNDYVKGAKNAIGTTFSLTDGLASLGQQLLDTLGINTDGSILDNITTTIFGEDGVPNLFEDIGDANGTSYATSFSEAVQNYDLPEEYAFGYSNDQDPYAAYWNKEDDAYSKFSSALTNASTLPDDIKNPVITPVLDDTEFRQDATSMLEWWNGKTYDQFAIDAGNSMTLREQAEGDAATDGNVSISYTQINNSPKELSPIEVYRDTKNLLRGSGQFRINA